MYKLVLVRHGESEWNKKNLFTGWTDVKLSENGVKEALECGKVLKENNYSFDLAFSSVLLRANNTLNIILNELDQSYVEVQKSWRLNERHYGSLQGLNKTETMKKYGEEKVLIWRRSYDVAPMPLDESDERHPINDKRYSNIPKRELPSSESLKDTVRRVVPYWVDKISLELIKGRSIILVAHGNSIRALMKYLDNINEDDMLNLNIPTGVPLIYEFDSNLIPIKHYYIGNEDDIKARVDSVVKQGKNK